MHYEHIPRNAIRNLDRSMRKPGMSLSIRLTETLFDDSRLTSTALESHGRVADG
jgi:hypothetical protein